MQKEYDVAIIGGGPAGMASAWAAARCGAKTVLLERASYLGGVLPQCVHDGFGLYSEGQSMTGPHYAQIWKNKLYETNAEIALDTSVISMRGKACRTDDAAKDNTPGTALSCVGPVFAGSAIITARTVILATGCREKSRGQLRIPGTRPAGIMTAGTAQYMMNIQNRLPGDKVVILGSGDIGLIMARRLKLEGADVRLVLGQKATGLYRNHVQCIREMDIPYRTGWTVVSVHGRGRLKGVTIAPVVDDGEPDLTQHEYIRCNTLLIAAGLIPEKDIEGLDDIIRRDDGSLLIAGNAEHIHDLADGAAIQGILCGVKAAQRAIGQGGTLTVPDDVESAAGMEMPQERPEKQGIAAAEDAGAEVTGYGIIPEICSGCPNSCTVELLMKGDEIIDIRGAGCDRGLEVIREQTVHPKRFFTGTVRIKSSDGRSPLLPVRSSDPVPVAELMPIARLCRRIIVNNPVCAGQIIKKNIGGFGADLLASCDSK